MRPDLLARFLRAIRIWVKNPRDFLQRIRQYVESSNGQGKSTLPAYTEWLSSHFSARVRDYPLPPIPVTFSILTTIYEKTDVKLLQETAQSIFAQTCPFHEWLILAHGPVSEGVNELLIHLEQQPQVLVHRLPKNLGIMGGMRFCLERAGGEYIVPMDADDLLTQDALQIMAAAIARADQPAILYSDEDMLIKGAFTAPYFRPDWDPILNLAGSYIWHLCIFRRDIALNLQVYTDTGSNWCHDWDTIFRFHNAGYIPLHVPEILYHWRQHYASSTNRPDPDSGSIRSTRYLLEQQIALQPRSDCYAVEVSPIIRGNQEWYIRRRPGMGLAMDIILVARNISNSLRTLYSVLQNTSYPFGSIAVCINGESDDKLKARFEMCIANACHGNTAALKKISLQFVANNLLDGIKIAASGLISPLTLFCSDAVEVKDGNWSWEALKLLELHRDVTLVGGRLLKGNRIVEGGSVFEKDGQLVCHDKGHHAGYPGQFSISLKQHTVNTVPVDFFVAKSEFITSALSGLPSIASLPRLSMWLGASALERNSRVGYSPYINVTVAGNVLGETGINYQNAPEREVFLNMYGEIVKRQLWSSSRFSRHKKYAN